jgi:hypothetical protein
VVPAVAMRPALSLQQDWHGVVVAANKVSHKCMTGLEMMTVREVQREDMLRRTHGANQGGHVATVHMVWTRKHGMSD